MRGREMNQKSVEVHPQFSVVETITIDRGPLSPENLSATFNSSNKSRVVVPFAFEQIVHNINPVFYEKKTSYDVVLVLGRQLGLMHDIQREELYRAGIRAGLELLPPEVVMLFLAEFYKPPTSINYLSIAMEPLCDNNGKRIIFWHSVLNEIKHISSLVVASEQRFSRDSIWAFVQPREANDATIHSTCFVAHA